MIKSLQSLRFVFALMIFFHHFPVNGEGLFEAGGTCGVSFFLILSGFVMSAGYGDKVSRQDFNYHNFLIKRIIRLYPLHIICLFVAAALALIAGSLVLKILHFLALMRYCFRVGFRFGAFIFHLMPFRGVLQT